MNQYFELVVVIPVYNEEKRLSLNKYFNFLKAHDDVMLCFVNDGSTDDTNLVLQAIESTSRGNVKLIEHSKNRSKAAAITSGFLHCTSYLKYNKIAYLDADLSTSLDECYKLSQHINEKTSFVFGSRIKKLDSYIKRKKFRFFVGRAVATLIANQLQLNVYDTQCGCKVFSSELAKQIMTEKFISTWLFDVEIFHRIQNLLGRHQLVRISKEIPLRSWIDKNHSKVSVFYFFKMWLELIMIQRKYSTSTNNESQTTFSEAFA